MQGGLTDKEVRQQGRGELGDYLTLRSQGQARVGGGSSGDERKTRGSDS